MLDARPRPPHSPPAPNPVSPRPAATGGRRGIAALSVVVLVIGLAVTAALSALCYVVNERNEARLLDLQTKQAATVLEVEASTLQTPLMSAAEVAEASDGDPLRFRNYMSHYVGPKGFRSASLWRLTGRSAQPITRMGTSPPPVNGGLSTVVASAAHSSRVVIVARLGGHSPALWYAATAGTQNARFGVSAVTALPSGRVAPRQQETAFAELHFALYLGPSTTIRNLLESDVNGQPLHGDTAKATIPFGNRKLTVVASARERLGGTLSAWLWWLVLIFGGCAAAAAAITAEWLIRRRATEQALRARVEELLAEQRDIAGSLQRALLPDRLPRVPGADVAVRYVPGTDGTEVGGDWYDILPRDDGRFVFVIGDVSGRGIRAATVMASLRFAIRGFVSEGHDPQEVLKEASKLIDLRGDRHFATVLCGCADLTSGELTFASAGHLPPILHSPAGTWILSGPVGPPLGVAQSPEFPVSRVNLPPAGMLLAFTDGLVERRGEDLDSGVDRLIATVQAVDNRGLDEQLDALIAALVTNEASDDTAVVGVRWT